MAVVKVVQTAKVPGRQAESVSTDIVICDVQRTAGLEVAC
jgi:hypothetical protein